MANDSGAHVGRLAKLYFNTGTYDVPIWAEVKKIGDVEVEDSSATSERDTRESPNTKTIIGNSKFALKFEYSKLRAVSDPVLRMIDKAKALKENIDCLALDDAYTVEGSRGLRGPFCVTSKNKNEPINDQVNVACELAEGLEYDDSDEIIDVEYVEITASGVEVDTFS